MLPRARKEVRRFAWLANCAGRNSGDRQCGRHGDALASRRLSAYLVYRLADAAAQREAARFSGNLDVRFECTVISNIFSAGLPPAEAAGVIVEKAVQILQRRAAGNRLGELLKA